MIKRIYIFFLFFLFGLCQACNSQSLKKQNKLTEIANKHKGALIFVNGETYAGNTEDIPDADIIRIDVLSAEGAASIYGKKAKNGVIDVGLNIPGIVDPVILDGNIHYKGKTDIDSSQILKEEVITRHVVLSSNFNDSIPTLDTITAITTIAYGTKKYQQRFSALSKDYQSYIKKHNGDDSRLLYLMPDGSIFNGQSKNIKRQLFEMAKADIESIEFSAESEKLSGKKPALVSINVKPNYKP